MGKGRKAKAAADLNDEEEAVPSPRKSNSKAKPLGAKPRPGKPGYEGTDDDGSAQSKFKGLSSGARASLRKKMEERNSGEGEAPELHPLPPPAPCSFVDVLIFPSEVLARKADYAEATQSAIRVRQPEGAGRSPAMSVLESVNFLAGPKCAATIGCYWEVAEMDATAGDVRFRAWESAAHSGLRHAAFGLEPRGVATLGAAASAASEGTTCPEPHGDGAAEASEAAFVEDSPVLQTLVEAWASPECVAAGPFGLDYEADDLASDDQRAYQRLGLKLLLRAAARTGHPIILTCRGGKAAAAEKDMASLVLATSAQPGCRWVCWEAGGLWARLHAKQPSCAWNVFDGSLTFSKASRDLLDLAFDVPLEHLLFASVSPRCLPAQAPSAAGRRAVCHSGHIYHTAERLAAIRKMPQDEGEATDDSAAGQAEGALLGAVGQCLAQARKNASLVFPRLRLQSADEDRCAESNGEAPAGDLAQEQAGGHINVDAVSDSMAAVECS